MKKIETKTGGIKTESEALLEKRARMLKFREWVENKTSKDKTKVENEN
jgi:hypothetical protein